MLRLVLSHPAELSLGELGVPGMLWRALGTPQMLGVAPQLAQGSQPWTNGLAGARVPGGLSIGGGR